jgi:nitrogen regulatory protein PII-like uncharacterized protein
VKLRIKTDSKQFELKEDGEEAEQLINDMAFDDESMVCTISIPSEMSYSCFVWM